MPATSLPSCDQTAIARRIRTRVIEMSHRAGTPHVGSALSCIDVLVSLYWSVLNIDPKRSDDPNRDRFILSKGHAASALYAVLAERGFFEPSLLDRYAEAGHPLAEQPAPRCVPGVEAATGSLGHGLPIGVGLALAARQLGLAHRTFVLLSDGECNEGAVWEAAMFAAARKLDRLGVIIDYNRWQATGRSNEVMALDPLPDKWTAFGWSAREVDGHDIHALSAVLQRLPNGTGRPVAVIAHTVKGKGVSFMEDDNNWHYRAPNPQELDAARLDLSTQ